MKLKTNLHFHCKEDPSDYIRYTFKEGITRASELGFEIIALTLHNAFGYTEERAQYAASKNILLIPGIEKTIQGRHVVILNCDRDSEKVDTFEALRAYRIAHPELFILAPHPYFPFFSLKEELKNNIDLFDGIEQSWYYSKHINGNKEAYKTACQYALPYIATSDTHLLKFIHRSYTYVHTSEKTVQGLLEALRKQTFENYSEPSHFLYDMFMIQGYISARDALQRHIRTLYKHLKKL